MIGDKYTNWYEVCFFVEYKKYIMYLHNKFLENPFEIWKCFLNSMKTVSLLKTNNDQL